MKQACKRQDWSALPVILLTMSQVEIPSELLQRLLSVQSVGVVTGAGLSVESGIRPYRGPGGIYDDPEEGDRTIHAMTGSTLQSDPDLTWRTLRNIRRFDARPNMGHEAIARIERCVPDFRLLTQNVDGLHLIAGSVKVIEIHGNARFTRCMDCDERRDLDFSSFHELQVAPRCEKCDGILRPDVVLFEEVLPNDAYGQMAEAFFYQSPDMIIIAGTSGGFQYIIDSVRLGQERGVITIDVNPEETECSQYCGFTFRGPASHWLPALADALEAANA